VIERLALLGATGDLTGRFLLPALASLRAAGRLPEQFDVLCAAREDLDDEAYRRLARERLDEQADVPSAAREAVLRSLRYARVDVTDSHSVASVIEPARGALAVYLALPPALFAATVTALATAGLPAGSRVVLEKPFGENLASATELNRLLIDAFGPASDEIVFRVDHVLGMPSVQNLIAIRLNGSVLDAVWNSAHVEQVEILWEETLALEGRAGYYDEAGALKDVMQNHMLQLLSLIAMEPPSSSDHGLHERKLEALRSIRPVTPTDVAKRTRRARYTAGRLADGTAVPDYVREDGVAAERETETFAEVGLELDSARWAGTPFVLRAGKALNSRRKMALLRFRSRRGSAEELWIGVDGPTELSLRLTGGAPGEPAPLTLSAGPPESELPPYGRVLLDVLEPQSKLSVSGAEAEEAWRVVTPVLDAWAEGVVQLETYAAGSAGPAARTD
jgi:glucose-6-phosphate 1-dehydrogenase